MRVQGIAVAGDVTGLPGVELRLDEPGSAIRRQSLTSLDLRSTYIVTLMTPCAMQPSLSSPSVYYTDSYTSIRVDRRLQNFLSREKEKSCMSRVSRRKEEYFRIHSGTSVSNFTKISRSFHVSIFRYVARWIVKQNL